MANSFPPNIYERRNPSNGAIIPVSCNSTCMSLTDVIKKMSNNEHKFSYIENIRLLYQEVRLYKT